MKQTKTSSLYRLVAFLLITIVLIGIVGVVADGARTKDNTSDKTPPTANQSGSETENNDGNTNEESNQQPTPELPKLTHYLTGLVTDESSAASIPLAYVVDPSSPLYGISSAYLTVEFATELGGSRMLLFAAQNPNLGKIGSITQTRGYINNLVSYFGGILVHNGTDGKTAGKEFDLGDAYLNLAASNKYAYSEGSRELYTNGQLMDSALENARIPTRYATIPTVPFHFRTGKMAVGSKAASVTIPYGTGNEVTLVYDSILEEYKMYRGTQIASDPLYRTELSYTNVLTLFCDAVTYEGSDSTTTVLDTVSGGSGYYFSMGAYQKIIWSTTEDGRMVLTDSAGVPLEMNAGTTYLSFYKASEKSKIILQR